MQPLPDQERLIPPEARSIPQRERLLRWGGALVLLALLVGVPGLLDRSGVDVVIAGLLTSLVALAALAVAGVLLLLGFPTRVRLVGAGFVLVVGLALVVLAGAAGYLNRP